MNSTPKTEYEKSMGVYNAARGNLLLVLILTLVNIILGALGSNYFLLFSATFPYFAAMTGFATKIPAVIMICCGISLICLAAYLLCWIFSKKRPGWLIAALILFVVDTGFMVALYVFAKDFSGVLDVFFHIWVCVCLINGVRQIRTIKNPPTEEELPVADQPDNPIPETVYNSSPYRSADTDAKAKILLEAEWSGHRICYRRIKRVNELVIDGWVYDDVELLVETAHSLNAIVDGHRFQVGFDGFAHSYIRVDGVEIAKKLRLI